METASDDKSVTLIRMLPQVRRVATKIPGPYSRDLMTRKPAAVAGGVSSAPMAGWSKTSMPTFFWQDVHTFATTHHLTLRDAATRMAIQRVFEAHQTRGLIP